MSEKENKIIELVNEETKQSFRALYQRVSDLKRLIENKIDEMRLGVNPEAAIASLDDLKELAEQLAEIKEQLFNLMDTVIDDPEEIKVIKEGKHEAIELIHQSLESNVEFLDEMIKGFK